MNVADGAQHKGRGGRHQEGQPRARASVWLASWRSWLLRKWIKWLRVRGHTSPRGDLNRTIDASWEACISVRLKAGRIRVWNPFNNHHTNTGQGQVGSAPRSVQKIPRVIYSAAFPLHGGYHDPGDDVAAKMTHCVILSNRVHASRGAHGE